MVDCCFGSSIFVLSLAQWHFSFQVSLVLGILALQVKSQFGKSASQIVFWFGVSV
jgi:hypothetical protein